MAWTGVAVVKRVTSGMAEGPPFLITITNDQNQTTSELEIYCRFH